MTNYNLNHESKNILISEEFAKNTNNIESPECATFMKVKAMFPDYTVKVVKTKGKNTYRNLSFEAMEIYITKILKDEKGHEEFIKVKEYYEGETARYGLVKSWFLNRYYGIKPKDIDALKPLANAVIFEEKTRAKLSAKITARKTADGVIRMIDDIYARNPDFIKSDTTATKPATMETPTPTQHSPVADDVENDEDHAA